MIAPAIAPSQAGAVIVNAEEGVVHMTPLRRKVVIAAFGHTMGAVQQFHQDPTWEIWGLNDGYKNRWLRNHAGEVTASRWFEMHPMAVQPKDDLDWLAICPMPVYLLELDPRVPNGVRYPLEQAERLASLPKPFWACSFSYMIALALMEGFTDIALCGMDFGTPREWLFERSNVLFYAGLAAGRGVRLHVPSASTFLFHPYRYGYDYDDEKGWCEEAVSRFVRVIHDNIPVAVAPV